MFLEPVETDAIEEIFEVSDDVSGLEDISGSETAGTFKACGRMMIAAAISTTMERMIQSLGSLRLKLVLVCGLLSGSFRENREIIKMPPLTYGSGHKAPPESGVT